MAADTLLEAGRRLALLPGADLARAASIRDSVAADAWRASRIAARLLVARHLGLEAARRPFSIAAGGKPVLPGIELSISHTDGAALVAVCHTMPIGIDIERARPLRMSAARRLTLEAAAAGAGGERPLPEDEVARTIAAWCRIEALAKASGRGVARTLSELGIRGFAAGGSTSARERQPLEVADIVVPAPFAAAIAARRLPGTYSADRLPDTPAALDAWLGQRP